MTQIPPAPPPRQPRSWFARNWKWFLPIAIVLPILFCCGGVSAIVAVAMGAIRTSEPYRHAMQTAQASPHVTAALGTPISAGFLVNGSIKLENDAGNADLEIPISGPNGSGTLHVAGTKSAGAWTYQTLTFHQSGSALPIDLTTTPLAPHPATTPAPGQPATAP